MTIALRAPTVDDADGLIVLLEQLGHPDQDGLVERIESWSNDPRAHLVVAEDGQEALLGLAAVYVQRNFHRPEPIAQLVSLVVAEQARRRGVGNLLMETVETFARQRGCLAIHLSSNRSRPESHGFYEAVGFLDRCETHARYHRRVPYAGA